MLWWQFCFSGRENIALFKKENETRREPVLFSSWVSAPLKCGVRFFITLRYGQVEREFPFISLFLFSLLTLREKEKHSAMLQVWEMFFSSVIFNREKNRKFLISNQIVTPHKINTKLALYFSHQQRTVLNFHYLSYLTLQARTTPHRLTGAPQL